MLFRSSGSWTNTGSPGWNSSVPNTSDQVVFGGTSGKTIDVSGFTKDLGGMTLSSNIVTNFSGTGPINFQNNKSINFNNNSVTFAPQITVGGLTATGPTLLTLSGSGTVTLNGNVLQGASASSSTLVVSGGLTLKTFTNFSSGATITNNGTTVLSGTTGSFRDFANQGTLSGAGTGVYFGSNFDHLALNSGSTVKTYIGGTTAGTYDSWMSTNPTSMDLGANLNINFGNITGAVNGTTWNIFNADNASNFGSVTATGKVNNVTVVFTQPGGPGSAWQSNDIGGGSFLVFKNNGDLVVVPEPSTIVFAGVGVAMAGWSAWKKRRLAKVLAKA